MPKTKAQMPKTEPPGPLLQSGTINPRVGIPCTAYFGRRAAFHEEEPHVPRNRSLSVSPISLGRFSTGPKITAPGKN
jgi:hypothetical protein